MKLKWIGPYVTHRIITTEDFANGGFQDEQPVDIDPTKGERALYCEVSDAAGEMLIRSEPGMWADVTNEVHAADVNGEGPRAVDEVDEDTEPEYPNEDED